MSLSRNSRWVSCAFGLVLGIVIVWVASNMLNVQTVLAGESSFAMQSAYTVKKIGNIHGTDLGSEEDLYMIIGSDGHIWFAEINNDVNPNSSNDDKKFFINIVHEYKLKKGRVK